MVAETMTKFGKFGIFCCNFFRLFLKKNSFLFLPSQTHNPGRTQFKLDPLYALAGQRPTFSEDNLWNEDIGRI